MEDLTLIQNILTHKQDIFMLVTSIIGTASIIVKLTPTTEDDKILAKIKKIVSKFIALN